MNFKKFLESSEIHHSLLSDVFPNYSVLFILSDYLSESGEMEIASALKSILQDDSKESKFIAPPSNEVLKTNLAVIQNRLRPHKMHLDNGRLYVPVSDPKKYREEYYEWHGNKIFLCKGPISGSYRNCETVDLKNLKNDENLLLGLTGIAVWNHWHSRRTEAGIPDKSTKTYIKNKLKNIPDSIIRHSLRKFLSYFSEVEWAAARMTKQRVPYDVRNTLESVLNQRRTGYAFDFKMTMEILKGILEENKMKSQFLSELASRITQTLSNIPPDYYNGDKIPELTAVRDYILKNNS